MSVEDTRYCLCCGENVPCNHVERHGRLEITCAYCGFTLEVQKSHEQPMPGEGYALIADDEKHVRDLVADALKTSKICSNVMIAENGLELTAAFSKMVAERVSADVAIIDLNMPIMDGITAARTIRAIESQYNLLSMPIIFFSAVKADESLRSQMDVLSPASYVKKGTDLDPDSLTKRVEQLVAYLIDKYRNTGK